MNKRGIGNEIDWIIGIGLFILSVALIFVVFKPGITPVYEYDTLLNIVQTGFNEEAVSEIQTVPIFVYASNNTYQNWQIIKLNNKKINVSCTSCSTEDDFDLKNLITGKNKSNIEVYYVKNDSHDPAAVATSGHYKILSKNDDVAQCYSGHSCRGTEPGREENVERVRDETYTDNNYRADKVKYNLNIGDRTITIPAKLENHFGKSKYLLVISDKEINFNTTDISTRESGSTDINACTPYGTSSLPYNPTITTSCQAMYEVGAAETIKGVDLASFLSLNLTSGTGCTTGYECIKEKWKFPASKEFSIQIESLSITETNPPPGTTPQLKQFSYNFPSNSAGPPKNINVFVRQFNDFILTDDGTKVPVNIRIMIW